MFIYKTTNKINNKQYIGLCTRDDKNYLGSGKLLKLAIIKYGRDNFVREVLEECDTFEQLLEKEIYWINYYDAVNNENFYNLSIGGYAGNAILVKEYWDSMTKEERKYARKWNGHFTNLDQTGDKHISKNSNEWCEKVATGVKNTWDNYTVEERSARGKIISKSRKESGIAKGNKNPLFGRSIVTERNLKWYTNGINTIYVTEGAQPEHYYRGRTIKPSFKTQRVNDDIV
jgi:hypothetical protein